MYRSPSPLTRPPPRQVCGEQLRRFFHEESEEWHLRDCIRVEGKAYHPGCFEDHKVSRRGALMVASEIWANGVQYIQPLYSDGFDKQLSVLELRVLSCVVDGHSI